MELVFKENEAKIMDGGRELGRIYNFSCSNDYYCGKLSFSNSLNCDERKSCLEFLGNDLRKKYPSGHLQLVLPDLKIEDSDRKSYFILNRAEMSVELDLFEIEPCQETLGNLVPLEYEAITKKAKEILLATPDYDRRMLSLDTEEDVIEIYRKEFKENAFGTYLRELSLAWEEPMKGFVILLEVIKDKVILIADLVVFPKYRKQGIGKELMIASISKAKELGYEKVMLSVTLANPAKYLYDKLGFKEIANVSMFYVI